VCRAGVGVTCKRPSGHDTFGGQPHPDRDRLAMQVVPGYGRCPAAERAKTPSGWVQPLLFAEPGYEAREQPIMPPVEVYRREYERLEALAGQSPE
jgi:hypothetical protein